jgi:hypothetical protein
MLKRRVVAGGSAMALVMAICSAGQSMQSLSEEQMVLLKGMACNYPWCTPHGDCSKKPCAELNTDCYTCSGSGTEKDCIGTIGLSPCHASSEPCGTIVLGNCGRNGCVSYGGQGSTTCPRDTCWNE